jgi:hypothetical protein
MWSRTRICLEGGGGGGGGVFFEREKLFGLHCGFFSQGETSTNIYYFFLKL